MFTQGVQVALLAMAGVSIVLFTVDRWKVRPDAGQGRGPSVLFANPFLKVAAILLLVLIVVGKHSGNVAWLVVGTVGATVAGADFVLLLTSLIFRN